MISAFEATVLGLVSGLPSSGYEIMKMLQNRGLYWAGSAGAVYSALERLKKRELVQEIETSGAKTFEITAEGTAALEDYVRIPVTASKLIMDPTLLRVKLRGVAHLSSTDRIQFYKAQLVNLTEAQRMVADRREGFFSARISIELAELAIAQLKLEEELIQKLLREELEKPSCKTG